MVSVPPAGRASTEEVEHRLPEGRRILEEERVTGVGVDDQPGVGDAARQEAGIADGDDEVLASVRYQRRLGEAGQLVIVAARGGLPLRGGQLLSGLGLSGKGEAIAREARLGDD